MGLAKLILISMVSLVSLAAPSLAAGDFQTDSASTANLRLIQNISATALSANIETVADQSFLTAGRHQFRSLWTRDFCHAVRGLLILKRTDVVRNQLDLIFLNLRQDGLVPRTLDSIPAQERVAITVATTAAQNYLPAALRPGLSQSFSIPLSINLKPEYVDENKTESIDGNTLVILASLQYFAATGDEAWLRSHLDDFTKNKTFTSN